MLNRLLPKQFDNDYQGHILALWLFAPLVIIKLLMGFNVSGLNPWIDNRAIATTVDRFPLDSYGADAASAFMFMFASWGLILFVFGLFATIALMRYRAMVPLFYVLLAIEQFGRYYINTLYPIARAVKSTTVSPAALFNWGLMAALALGLILAFWPRTHTRA
jgi:hypothetical protein